METADTLVRAVLESVDSNCALVDEPIIRAFEEEAISRSARDENDWPLVAGALALDAGVWTNDNDLLGTGVPTWITETVQRWLDHNQDG